MTLGGGVVLVVVGALGGLLATYAPFGGRSRPGGWVVDLVGGLAGAFSGGLALGRWGWILGGVNVIGGTLCAVLIPYAVQAVAALRGEP